MFYGLATNKVRVPGLRFTHTLCDIETLNRKAMEGVYDLTAISFHAFPYIQDHYAIAVIWWERRRRIRPDGCGQPSIQPVGSEESENCGAGTLTTAYLALKLFAPGVETEVVPFDQIIPSILEGNTKPE